MSGGLRAWGTHQGAVLLQLRWTSFLARLSRFSIQTLLHSLALRQDTKTEVAEVLTKLVGNQVQVVTATRTKACHDKTEQQVFDSAHAAHRLPEISFRSRNWFWASRAHRPPVSVKYFPVTVTFLVRVYGQTCMGSNQT